MAKRLLKDWTMSDKVNKLSAPAEVFFTRLIMKADDFGSFWSNPTILKSNLFPLRVDHVNNDDVAAWVTECVNSELLFLYEVNGKYYLRINDFGQRLRSMKGRFPEPPTIDSGARTTASDCRPEEEVEEKKNSKKKEKEKEKEKEKREWLPPEFIEVFEKWMEYKRQRKETYKSEDSEKAFLKKLQNYSGNNPAVAMEIVEQSMASNWAGIFELKNNGKQKSTSETRIDRQKGVNDLKNLSIAILENNESKNSAGSD